MKKDTYRFKKGQEISLDEIYMIQGLAGGDWWKRKTNDDCDEDLIITRDVEIVITWK